MRALKVMMPDGTILAYRLLKPITAVEIADLTEEELASYGEHKPDVQTIFRNSGHLNVKFTA